MPRSHSRLRRRVMGCRADFGWFVLILLAAFLCLAAIVDRCPRMYDLEFSVRLELLKQRIAEAPQRPVLAFVGSSRVGVGFHPEQMPEVWTPDGQPVLAFTFSHVGAGPVFNLLQVKRLLRAGIRPGWIVLELAPAILFSESTSRPSTDTNAADLSTMLRYNDAGKVMVNYLRSRLNPWYRHRQVLLEQFAPALACPRVGRDKVRLNPLGGDNFWICPEHFSPGQVRHETDLVLAGIGYDEKAWLQQGSIPPVANRAVRDLIGVCRAEGIGVVLVMTPESSEYQRLYCADARCAIKEFTAELEQSCGIPVVDARDWVADEGFLDGFHLARHGAIAFTCRLASEVLQPLVNGRLDPSAERRPAGTIGFCRSAPLAEHAPPKRPTPAPSGPR